MVCSRVRLDRHSGAPDDGGGIGFTVRECTAAIRYLRDGHYQPCSSTRTGRPGETLAVSGRLTGRYATNFSTFANGLRPNQVCKSASSCRFPVMTSLSLLLPEQLSCIPSRFRSSSADRLPDRDRRQNPGLPSTDRLPRRVATISHQFCFASWRSENIIWIVLRRCGIGLVSMLRRISHISRLGSNFPSDDTVWIHFCPHSPTA